MRLAIIGPQNTGKTTFVKDFIKAFPHYKTPKGTYRDVVKKYKLKINQETSEASQKEIRKFMFDQVKGFQGENVIFDRSLLDIYTLAKYKQEKIKKSFLDETKEMMYASLRHIDRLVLIPTAAGIDLVNDSLRDTDRLYIDYINKLFLEEIIDLVRESPIPVWVISGSRESRIEQLRDKLNHSSLLQKSPMKAGVRRNKLGTKK
jgi:GTPase SAR1 family protein